MFTPTKQRQQDEPSSLNLEEVQATDFLNVDPILLADTRQCYYYYHHLDPIQEVSAERERQSCLAAAATAAPTPTAITPIPARVHQADNHDEPIFFFENPLCPANYVDEDDEDDAVERRDASSSSSSSPFTKPVTRSRSIIRRKLSFILG